MSTRVSAFNVSIIIIAIPICFIGAATAPYANAMPEWAKSQGQVVSGSIYRVVCSGNGPSIDIARNEAVQSCKASATGFLQRDGRVNALSIESEKDVSYYQEISETVSYRGLVCIPEREVIEDLESGSFRLWVLCKFDLSTVEVGKDSIVEEPLSPSQSSIVPSLSGLKERSFSATPGAQTSKTRTVINIAVVPKCTKILIRGLRPRSLDCTTNPIPVVVGADDTEMIITSSGYVSKKLLLQGRGWKDNETIQAVLESP